MYQYWLIVMNVRRELDVGYMGTLLTLEFSIKKLF